MVTIHVAYSSDHKLKRLITITYMVELFAVELVAKESHKEVYYSGITKSRAMVKVPLPGSAANPSYS